MPPEYEVVWNGAVNLQERQLRPAVHAPLNSRSIWPSKICARCGESFRVRPSEVHRRRHCSRSCVPAATVTKRCPQCLGTFSVAYKCRHQVHCSQRCNGAATAARRTSERMAEMGRKGGRKSAAMKKGQA